MKIRISIVALAMVMMLGCKQKAPPPAMPGPATDVVEGALVSDGQTAIVVHKGDATLVIPIKELPAGSKVCTKGTCVDVPAGTELGKGPLVPFSGCPCRLRQCSPLCRPQAPDKFDIEIPGVTAPPGDQPPPPAMAGTDVGVAKLQGGGLLLSIRKQSDLKGEQVLHVPLPPGIKVQIGTEVGGADRLLMAGPSGCPCYNPRCPCVPLAPELGSVAP